MVPPGEREEPMSLWLSRNTGALGRVKAPQSFSGHTQWLGSALHWGRLAKSRTHQKPDPAPKTRLKPALPWCTGPKEGLAGLQGSREKRRRHSSFCPAPRHGSGMSGALVTSSGSTKTQHRRCWAKGVQHRPPALPMLSQPWKDHLTALSRTVRAQMPRPAGAQLHPP